MKNTFIHFWHLTFSTFRHFYIKNKNFQYFPSLFAKGHNFGKYFFSPTLFIKETKTWSGFLLLLTHTHTNTHTKVINNNSNYNYNNTKTHFLIDQLKNKMANDNNILNCPTIGNICCAFWPNSKLCSGRFYLELASVGWEQKKEIKGGNEITMEVKRGEWKST